MFYLEIWPLGSRIIAKLVTQSKKRKEIVFAICCHSDDRARIWNLVVNVAHSEMRKEICLTSSHMLFTSTPANPLKSLEADLCCDLRTAAAIA